MCVDGTFGISGLVRIGFCDGSAYLGPWLDDFQQPLAPSPRWVPGNPPVCALGRWSGGGLLNMGHDVVSGEAGAAVELRVGAIARYFV